ncbi:MAG TPA: family 78 glycoside hydrolase catalytic domain, partial [Spirochaetia bacterium]|nr:family 78 glycoside hydrolase catalytic domain [Spirochaetia bacterium]
GSAGTDVRIRHGEVLNPDGTLYRTNLRIVPDRPTWGAQQEDHYLCRGSGDECFEPHFTYHGFRYVEVSGLEKAPVPWDIVGRVLHSTSPEVGTLECSSPVLNRVLAAIQWTQRGNMQGVPTDCPQRDERLGWAGDIQVFSWTAMFNRDMAAFFTKWIRDLREGQAADGRLPDFAPHPYDPNARFSGNPGWSDAALLIPWRMYVAYGDREILAEAFEAASRWVEYSLRSNPDLIWRDQGACTPAYYGDWLNSDTFVDIPGLPRKGGEVPKEVYATAYFAYSASIAGKMAQVLGKTEEANRYTRLASRVRAAFLKEFVASDGKIKGDTQAGYALALHFDLLPAALRKKALARLVSALEPYRGGLSTGFLSTVPMMLELVRGGHVEEAYRLLLRREMPSWCYMVEHGGTTVWERWDGFVEGRGFQNPGMNSFNHYAIGSVGEWMWRVIAGINPLEEAPGCSTVRINPIPGGGLTWARASWRSIRGPLAIEWNRSAETFTMDVTIPPNMSAEIVLPGATAALTTESQTPLARAVGVSLKGRRAEGLVLQVGSGAYHFEADLKTAAPARTKAAVARAKRPAAPRRRKASAPPRRKR